MRPIKVIQFAWVFEIAILIINWLIFLYWEPTRVAVFNSTLPFITPLILAQGGCALGGPQWKKHLENKKSTKPSDMSEKYVG